LEKISLAVIGCGAVAELQHLPSLRRIPEVEVSRLVDTNSHRAEKLKADFRLTKAKIYDSYIDAVEDEVDAILVLTPPKSHASICIDALKKGKHVFCEKPISSTLEDAERIVQAANSSNSVFMIGYLFRFSNVFGRTRKLIDLCNLDIDQFECHYSGWVSKYPAITSFRFQKDEGGIILESASHIIDLLHWYLGKVKYVSATVGHVLGLPVEDTGSLSLEFENDHIVLGSISLSWASDPRLELEFHGKNETLVADYDRHRIILNLVGRSVFKGGPLHLIVRDRNTRELTSVELNYFARRIIKNEKAKPDAVDGFNALAVVKAAYESVEKEKKMPVMYH